MFKPCTTRLASRVKVCVQSLTCDTDAAVMQHVQDVPGDDITYQALTWAGTYPYLYVGGQSQVIHVCQLVR